MQLNAGLRRLLRIALDGFVVEPNRYVLYPSTDEFRRLETAVLANSPWKELFGEFEFTSEIAHQTRRLAGAVPNSYAGLLKDAPVANLIATVEDGLVRFLEALPVDCDVFFEVRRFPRLHAAETELGLGVALVDTAEGFHANIVGPRDDNLVEAHRRPRLRHDSVYLRFVTKGYVTSGWDSYALSRALARLKHFIYLARMEHVLAAKGLADIMNALSAPPILGAHALIRADHPDAADIQVVVLSQEVAEYLYWLRLNEKKLQTIDLSSGRTLIKSLRQAQTAEEKREALPSALSNTLAFLQIPDEHPDAERIRATMEWAFDADTTGNETIALLQRWIGIEALIGDKDTGRITDKLADRYAYLLGRTHSERETLRQKFIDSYNHRSEIMHGRRARLAPHNISAGFLTREMLSRLLEIEIRGLLRAIQEQNASEE